MQSDVNVDQSLGLKEAFVHPIVCDSDAWEEQGTVVLIFILKEIDPVLISLPDVCGVMTSTVVKHGGMVF